MTVLGSGHSAFSPIQLSAERFLSQKLDANEGARDSVDIITKYIIKPILGKLLMLQSGQSLTGELVSQLPIRPPLLQNTSTMRL